MTEVRACIYETPRLDDDLEKILGSNSEEIHAADHCQEYEQKAGDTEYGVSEEEDEEDEAFYDAGHGDTAA